MACQSPTDRTRFQLAGHGAEILLDALNVRAELLVPLFQSVEALDEAFELARAGRHPGSGSLGTFTLDRASRGVDQRSDLIHRREQGGLVRDERLCESGILRALSA